MARDLRDAIQLLERGDWRAAHEIAQQDDDSPLFCWAHGIVHLMEGDLDNARYWYRRAGRPPFTAVPSIPGEIRALKEEIGL
jgi:hypothetical protein